MDAEAMRAAIEAEHEMPAEHRAFLGPDFPPHDWSTIVRGRVRYEGIFAGDAGIGRCYDAIRHAEGEPPARVAIIDLGNTHLAQECDEWTMIERRGLRMSVVACEGGHRWQQVDLSI